MKLWSPDAVLCRQYRDVPCLHSHITGAPFPQNAESKTIKSCSAKERLSKWMPGLSHWLNRIVFLQWFIGQVCALSHLISLFHASTSRTAFYTWVLTSAAKLCKLVHKLLWNASTIWLIRIFSATPKHSSVVQRSDICFVLFLIAILRQAIWETIKLHPLRVLVSCAVKSSLASCWDERCSVSRKMSGFTAQHITQLQPVKVQFSLLYLEKLKCCTKTINQLSTLFANMKL